MLILWVKLTCIPIEIWDNLNLNIIGDSLRTFLKVTLETKSKANTYVTSICVEMDIAQGMSYVIMIEARENHYLQTLDYKNVSLRCIKCISHVDLKISFPYNRKSNRMGGAYIWL